MNMGVIFNQYEEIKRVLCNKDMAWVEERLGDIKLHAIEQTEFYKDYELTDEFPVVNKMTLIENHDACLAKEGYQTPIHISSTSGSTGTPFSVTQDFKKRNRTIADLKFLENFVIILLMREWCSSVLLTQSCTGLQSRKIEKIFTILTLLICVTLIWKR